MRLAKWIINLLIIITLIGNFIFNSNSTYVESSTIALVNIIIFYLLVITRICLTVFPIIMDYTDKKTGRNIDWWLK